MNKLSSPEFMAKFHAVMTILWMLLLIPSLIWWKESVLWVIVMSLWANVASHWAGFQASQGEKRTKEQD